MSFPRASGVLLHVTSLPGQFGIGDLGDNARLFVDFLAAGGQSYWQVLPLGQTGYGDSPYQCFSAFAGNLWLISPEKIVADGFLQFADIKKTPNFPIGKVDYGAVQKYKTDLLKKAFASFRRTDDQNVADSFHRFCDFNRFWLDDYALFRALKFSTGQISWQEWDAPLKLRQPAALAEAREKLDDEIFAQKFYQYLFFKQWDELKNYANVKNVRIIGDVPIFVALDSADVWCNPPQFKLNADGSPAVVAGVPPDYFSRTGQLWGNPIYNWDAMRADGFRWWIERLRFTLKMFDIARIDHFRGFVAAWEVPGGDSTAERGRWGAVPGRELFAAVRDALGDLPLMAEDLGEITPEVETLRDSFGLPGMRILQFAFGGDAGNLYLPHNHVKNSVVYTGTHDNDTSRGWFDSLADKRVREHCLRYLGSEGREIHWDLIRAAFASVADTAIVPLQDLLGSGGEARMNLPASDSGNWQWRAANKDFSAELSDKLLALTKLYGRTSNRSV